MDDSPNFDRIRLGQLGEDRAVALYRDWGYEIIARNDSFPQLGELDFVARKDGLIAFVEVRTRATDSGGHPLESITPAKRSKIIRAAILFWDRMDQTERVSVEELRFDVVAVEERRYGLAITPVFGAFEMDRVW
ncbi:YraN family protein [Myxococcota bacterium]|nr:YraN family protein [Myxococcota bacterium]